MEKIITSSDLKITIKELEHKQAYQWALLREQSLVTYESLKPANIVRKTFTELLSAPTFNKENILNATLSIATGYLSKKILVGATHNPIKQLLGTLLQIGVTNVVSKNTDEIKLVAGKLIHTLFTKKDTPA